MNKEIDKLKYLIEVAESSADRIVPGDRIELHRAVVAAMDANPEVSDVFKAIDKLRDKRQLDTLLTKIAAFVDGEGQLTLDDLQNAPFDRWNCWASQDRFVPTVTGSTGNHSVGRLPSGEFGIYDDRLFFKCSREDLPSGLCFIEVAQPSSHIVVLVLARLLLIQGSWVFDESIESALGRKPSSSIEAKYAIPAGEETRPMFETQRVKAFLSSIEKVKPDDAQLKAAQEFLA